MELSDQLHNKARPIWEKTLNHPFILGIGDGSLPLNKFGFYMRQDYLFLIEYSRLLALAVSKASELTDMGKLAEFLHSTLNTEMELHRRFAEKFGISPRALAQTHPTPTTHAYTRHLLYVSYSGTIGEILAALLPCQWGYQEIGQSLAEKEEPPRQPLYAQWIQMYISPEYGALTQEMISLFNRLSKGAGRRERGCMKEIFLTSSRYEYLFWDMSYCMQRWPI